MQLLYLHYVYAMHAKFILPLFAYDYEQIALFFCQPVAKKPKQLRLSFFYCTPVAVLAKHFRVSCSWICFPFFFVLCSLLTWCVLGNSFQFSVSTFAYLAANQSSMQILIFFGCLSEVIKPKELQPVCSRDCSAIEQIKPVKPQAEFAAGHVTTMGIQFTSICVHTTQLSSAGNGNDNTTDSICGMQYSNNAGYCNRMLRRKRSRKWRTLSLIALNS